ncbi:hypothetical protein O0L34_g15881 [Tuta absoluta]|nr:hypothetical protein O0L34_g15881 [Tuta absoluta]
MKRVKRHKIKHEKPETSSAFTRAAEEHDLAYYIHDRVELMHQVFLVLKSKDLRVMAPECVRRLSIDDLQELCTEELLGISSKRLLAILDGAEPPSDTESSSQSSEHIEAISLDSISSDDEILSQGTKKKRKHKRRDSTKSKKHKDKSKKPDAQPREEPEKSKASRAGLTVLELLELQARARAIRAQLQQEQAKRIEPVVSQSVASSQSASDSDIEVKEEPAEVVEIISSDDEKPKIEVLDNASSSAPASKEPGSTANCNTSTPATVDNNTDSSKKKTKKKHKETKDKGKKQKENVSKESDETRKESTSSKDSNQSTKDRTETNKTDSVDAIENDTNKNDIDDNQRVTKRVNDLIITVPQQSTRKIKLNRNKMTVSISNTVENSVSVVENTRSLTSVVTRPDKPDEGKSKNKEKTKKKSKKVAKRQSIDEDHDEITLQLSDSEKMDLLENFDKRNYDNVSSTSSDSESSSSSSSAVSEESPNASKDLDTIQENTEDTSRHEVDTSRNAAGDVTKQNNAEKDTEATNLATEIHTIEKKCEITKHSVDGGKKMDNVSKETEAALENTVSDITINEENCNTQNDVPIITVEDNVDNSPNDILTKDSESPEKDQSPKTSEDVINSVLTENEIQHSLEISKIVDIPVQGNSHDESRDVSDCMQNQDESPENLEKKENSPRNDNGENYSEEKVTKQSKDSAKKTDEELSEGEISNQESSDVEAMEVQPEVVCISDDETPKKKNKKDKKGKKAKKEKKKKSDFRESADQNFFPKTNESFKTIDNQDSDKNKNYEHTDEKELITLDDDDDIYEILELSDDSSCYEVEGTTLSKEPTVEEIAALSAKIDEFEREEVVTEQEILIHETSLEERNKNQDGSSNDEIEKMSWKDRYLGSKKVKKVLTTSNILNAMRKKNKELKKKMEESKKKDLVLEAEKARQEEAEKKNKLEQKKNLEEGSIEQYNTLDASTKYVDPVPDPVEIAKKKEEELKEQELKEAEMKEQERKAEEEIIKQKEKEVDEAIQSQVTGEMKKDAKQLLTMYKKLLKYNDIKKQRDPNKKKSKKKKKKDNAAAAV